MTPAQEDRIAMNECAQCGERLRFDVLETMRLANHCELVYTTSVYRHDLIAVTDELGRVI